MGTVSSAPPAFFCWVARGGSGPCPRGRVGMPFVRLLLVLTVSGLPHGIKDLGRDVPQDQLGPLGAGRCSVGVEKHFATPWLRRTCAPACRIGSVMTWTSRAGRDRSG